MVSRRSLLYSLGGIGLGGSVYAGLQSPDDTAAETDAASDQTSEAGPDWQPATTAQLTHEYINDNRAQHDHTRMEWHDGLASVASDYAETMGTESFFSHTHEGRNGGERLDRAGVEMQTWGENIVYTWWDRPLDDGEVRDSPALGLTCRRGVRISSIRGGTVRSMMAMCSRLQATSHTGAPTGG